MQVGLCERISTVSVKSFAWAMLISLPSQLVTESLFRSTNDAREPDRLCVHLLSSLHDEITKFLD